MIVSAVILLTPTLFYDVLNLRSKMIRYIVLALLVFMSGFMYAVLSYHVIIMLALPVVVSCLYCERSKVIYTTVLSIPVMIISHIIAFKLRIVPDEPLVTIKGVLLASSGIANSIFFSDFREVAFSMNKDTYKATSRTYLTNYLICVIVPSNTPDNITLYILNEFVSFCELFFENFENDSKKFSNILNKYAEILFYITANYTLKASKEDIIFTIASTCFCIYYYKG